MLKDPSSGETKFMTIGIPLSHDDFVWRAKLIAKYPDMFSNEIISFVTKLIQKPPEEYDKKLFDSIPEKIKDDHLYKNSRDRSPEKNRSKDLFLSDFDLTVLLFVETGTYLIKPSCESKLLKSFEHLEAMIKNNGGSRQKDLLKKLNGPTPLDRARDFFSEFMSALLEHEFPKIRAKLALWEIFAFFDQDLFIPKLVSITPNYLHSPCIGPWLTKHKRSNSKKILLRLRNAIFDSKLIIEKRDVAGSIAKPLHKGILTKIKELSKSPRKLKEFHSSMGLPSEYSPDSPSEQAIQILYKLKVLPGSNSKPDVATNHFKDLNSYLEHEWLVRFRNSTLSKDYKALLSFFYRAGPADATLGDYLDIFEIFEVIEASSE